jgi:hypothetical protein
MKLLPFYLHQVREMLCPLVLLYFNFSFIISSFLQCVYFYFYKNLSNLSLLRTLSFLLFFLFNLVHSCFLLFLRFFRPLFFFVCVFS